MKAFRISAVFGAAVLAALAAAPQPKDQPYEAKFECAIPASGATCSVTADAAIPAGKRLRVEYVKARIVVPSRIKSPFELSMEVGDPGAPGGVRSIKVTPTQVGRTEGGFFTIWSLNEKLQEFAYGAGKYPAPKFSLTSPDRDPLKLLNGAIQDGVVGGALVAID